MISRRKDTGGKALKMKGCGEIEGTGDFPSSTEMGRSSRKRSDWQATNVGGGGSWGAAGGGLTGRHPLWGLLKSRTPSAHCWTFALVHSHSLGGPQTFGWSQFHYCCSALSTAHCSGHTDSPETSNIVRFVVPKDPTLYMSTTTAGLFTTCHVVIIFLCSIYPMQSWAL